MVSHGGVGGGGKESAVGDVPVLRLRPCAAVGGRRRVARRLPSRLSQGQDAIRSAWAVRILGAAPKLALLPPPPV